MIEVNNLFLTIKKVPILVDINTSFERGNIHGLILPKGIRGNLPPVLTDQDICGRIAI